MVKKETKNTDVNSLKGKKIQKLDVSLKFIVDSCYISINMVINTLGYPGYMSLAHTYGSLCYFVDPWPDQHHRGPLGKK